MITATPLGVIEDPQVKRVLVSVTDKTGVVEFARALSQEFGAEIVSTGGTAKVLEAAGIAVRPIDELTGFPEMMDGRVKTLHPLVHGGLLARRDLESHMADAQAHGIGMIDMIVVNLYAFEETVATPGTSYQDCVENIDIGGPSMLRSAAKNHASVAVVTRPETYDAILDEMRANGGRTTLATRKRLALDVFRTTSAYDNAIFSWLQGELDAEDAGATGADGAGDGDVACPSCVAAKAAFPQERRLFLTKKQDLRYGENPHQKAAFYTLPMVAVGAGGDGAGGVGAVVSAGAAAGGVAAKGADAAASAGGAGVAASTVPQDCYALANAKQLQGKEMSYNNFLDTDAAWAAVREFTEPTCVIVKHLTPCGIASDDDIVAAYQRAHACDTVSAYGGVMAFNRSVPAALIEAVFANKQFIEALIAPAFEEGALELLTQKPNARVLATGGINPAGRVLEYRAVEGGMLVQELDSVAEAPATVEEARAAFTVPTKRQPTDEELEELLFAWRACKAVKSNAIVITKDHATVGTGAGQPNRVNSARIAVEQAGEKTQGAVAASDAFLPFADTLEVLDAAGVTALIQPGGSIRDEEVIAAADERGVAMVFTGHRHFRH